MGAVGTPSQPRQVLLQGRGPLPAPAASPMLSMVTARAISVEGWNRWTGGGKLN